MDLTPFTVSQLKQKRRYYAKMVQQNFVSAKYRMNASALVEDLEKEIQIREGKI